MHMILANEPAENLLLQKTMIFHEQISENLKRLTNHSEKSGKNRRALRTS